MLPPDAGAGGTAVVLPFGEDGLVVDLREPAGIRAARRARVLAAVITSLAVGGEPLLAGVGVPVAAASSVLVPLAGPGLEDSEARASLLAGLARALPDDPPPPHDARDHVIRVEYGGAHGPDLDAVAAECGVTPDDVIGLHGSVAYEVLFLGFAPGFGYLGELPEAIRLPRLATPRVHVPAGSVAIAGALTAVYPQAGPGGWRLLGRTGAALFDPTSNDPVLLRPGDRVRFRPA